MNTKNVTFGEQTRKIISGLDVVWEKLVAEKRAKNQPFVVMRDDKIEYVKI